MKARLPVYAGRGERLFAYLIDVLAIMLIATIIATLLQANALGVLIFFFTNVAYFTYFTASSWQATPGKRLLHIYVIRTDYHRLNIRDALERFLGRNIPELPLYSSLFLPHDALFLSVCLELFWFTPILFTPERIGYHDRLCNTRVVIGKVGA